MYYVQTDTACKLHNTVADTQRQYAMCICVTVGTLDPSSLPLVPGKPERPPWLDKTPDQPSSGLTMNLYIMQNLCHIELTGKYKTKNGVFSFHSYVFSSEPACSELVRSVGAACFFL